MSYNLTFGYIKTVLDENGPLTGTQIEETLPQFGSAIGRTLTWALDNESLVLDGDRYVLTERGRR